MKLYKFNKIKLWFRSIKLGIKNIIFFWNVIWNFRSGDQCFWYALMGRMFEKAEKDFRKCPLLNAERYAHQIMQMKNICKDLSNRDDVEFNTFKEECDYVTRRQELFIKLFSKRWYWY
jgi:hypothetical protein